MKRRLLSVAVAFAACSTAIIASPPATPKADKLAPDVALASDRGGPTTLSSYRGKVVLVDFWASWCIPCRASFPALDALDKEFRDKGFLVLALNEDEQRRDADQFLAPRPHTMAVVFDPNGKAAEAFGLKGMPSSIVIDRTGHIRFRHVGYNEKTLVKYREEILSLLGES